MRLLVMFAVGIGLIIYSADWFVKSAADSRFMDTAVGTREYDSITAAPGWNPDGFLSGNNQITAWNHSNGDVLVSFNVTQNNLPGVDFEINTANALGAAAAVDVLLGKVPYETATAPSIDAYLRLDNEPDNLNTLNDTAYTKIAVITVTIEPAGGTLTPRG